MANDNKYRARLKISAKTINLKTESTKKKMFKKHILLKIKNNSPMPCPYRQSNHY